MDVSALGAYADSFRAQIRKAPQNGNLHLGLGILLQVPFQQYYKRSEIKYGNLS